MLQLSPIAGGGDNYSQINAALTTGSNWVHLSGGTYPVSQMVDVPAGVTLTGENVSSVLVPTATMSAILKLCGDHARAENLQVLQQGGYAGAGIQIASGTQFVEANKIYAANLPIGVQNSGAQAWLIDRIVAIACDFGIFSQNDGRNSTIRAPFIQGGTCIWIDKQTQQCEGLDIDGGKLLPSVTGSANSGYGLMLAQSFLEVGVRGTVIDQIPKAGIRVVGENGNGNYQALKMTDVWLGAQAGVSGSCGALITGAPTRVSMKGCTVTGAQGYGVNIDNLSHGNGNQFDIAGNFFFSNGAGDLRVNGLLWSVIARNQFNSSLTTVEDMSSNNEWLDNVYTGSPVTRSASSRYWCRGANF